jgi:hypothetical protein
MAARRVTFLDDRGRSFSFNLCGPDKKHVRMATVLTAFGAEAVSIGNDLLDADGEGFSFDSFDPGTTQNITVFPRTGDRGTTFLVDLGFLGSCEGFEIPVGLIIHVFPLLVCKV